METTGNVLSEAHRSPKKGRDGCQEFGYEVQSVLQDFICLPWIPVVEELGIHVLLLSRKQVKTVQRDVYFSYSGEEKITVHCKPIPSIISNEILLGRGSDKFVLTQEDVNVFVKRIVTVVKRLQSYEVCVGVDEPSYEPLWELQKDGEIERDVFKELRYQLTFRPSKCHLLVNSTEYLKRRCPVCVQTKIRFRAKIARRKNCIVSPTTPNMYLGRDDLLSKVLLQKKKLKYSQDQISKLKAKMRRATSLKGIDDSLSEELINICMGYVTSELEISS